MEKKLTADSNPQLHSLVNVSAKGLSVAAFPAEVLAEGQLQFDNIESVAADIGDAITRKIIENACLANERKPTVYLPAAFGGQLETVRAKVQATIAMVTASGETVNNAQVFLTQGDTFSNNGDFKSAFTAYCRGLCQAVSLPGEASLCLSNVF